MAHLPLKAWNHLGAEYSLFDMRAGNTTRDLGGLLERVNFMQGKYRGGSFHVPVTRYSYLGIGIGLMTLDYQKEVSGIFPETGQYGTVLANGHTAYWSFPLSFECMNAGRSDFRRGFVITYMPSVEGRNTFTINSYAGAGQSAYAAGYSNHEQVFMHALIFSLTNQLNFCRGHLRVCIDPYAGISSGIFNYQKAAIANLKFGISFRILFKPPHISIECEHTDRNGEKKKLLEQKQKEIEQQLKNKPKQ